MKNPRGLSAPRAARRLLFPLLLAALLTGVASRGVEVSANHPVIVEGNCDSPVPGTTIVPAGTCGDYDGDGRIGTAEDTDGSDRIFGTINAALGNVDLGATINATTAGMNGTVLIVRSGRFAESISVAPNALFPNPGNVTIEAAPGVLADIDAVLSGDPAGGNATRQQGPGVLVDYPSSLAGAPTERVVVLRNLDIRNFNEGVRFVGVNRLLAENCRFEHNVRSGITLNGAGNLVVKSSVFNANGRRVNPSVDNSPNPGDGIIVEQTGTVRVFDSLFTHNAGVAIRNSTNVTSKVALYRVATYFNAGGDFAGVVTISPDPNYSN